MIEYNNLLNDIIITNTNNYISLNLFLFIIITLILSITIDIIFGELPTKIHPVVIIGSLTNFFKKHYIKIKNKTSGLLTVISVNVITLIILYIIYYITSINNILFLIVFTVLLSSTFSIKMLINTARDVKKALDENIDKARQLVSYLVSRNTNELTETFIISATIESLTENITDSYIAPIFYYFIFAVIILDYHLNNQIFYLLAVPMIYRVSNTLDAMLGYKTEELNQIGYFPAIIDDILNYIPSRIAGIYIIISSYLLKLDWKNAYKIMKKDARKCPSPNSGYTMATTAGALNIQLIKKDTYTLGNNNKNMTKEDITKSIKLTKLTINLYTLTIIILLTLIYMII